MQRRILLLITDLEIGGTPTVVRELAIRLNDPPNVEIEVACLKRRGPVADQIEAAGIAVTTFDAARIWQLPATVRRLRELVRQRKIDTVFSFLIHANAVAAIASRDLPGVRFLQSIQTVQPRPRWHWWLQRRIHGRADKVVGPSTAVADVARKWCGVPEEKIVVIPNAIDPRAFPRVEIFRDPGRIVVGFLGRLDPIKRVPRFVGSVAHASRPGVVVEGHIFGDGADLPAIKTAITEIETIAGRDHIFLHGLAASPQAVMQQMDVLFLPSIGEGFGLVLIEAMASGVPVIACAVGGVTDIVQDGVNGFLVEPTGPASGRAAGLFHLLREQPELRRRIVESALTTVRDKFTWDVVLPQYRELLDLVPSPRRGEG